MANKFKYNVTNVDKLYPLSEDRRAMGYKRAKQSTQSDGYLSELAQTSTKRLMEPAESIESITKPSTDSDKSKSVSIKLTKARSIAATKLANELIRQYGFEQVYKQCTSCWDWKSFSEYHKSYDSFLGLKSTCKVCSIKQSTLRDHKTNDPDTNFYEYRYLMRKGKTFEGHWKFKISNQQSTISNQQSTISNQQSTISNQQSTISNQL